MYVCVNVLRNYCNSHCYTISRRLIASSHTHFYIFFYIVFVPLLLSLSIFSVLFLFRYPNVTCIYLGYILDFRSTDVIVMLTAKISTIIYSSILNINKRKLHISQPIHLWLFAPTFDVFQKKKKK